MPYVDGLAGDLERQQMQSMSALLENVGNRILALPNGASKSSFMVIINPVRDNIFQIASKQDYNRYPALFASEYQRNMEILQKLDQQMAMMTAEPTVVPPLPYQPALQSPLVRGDGSGGTILDPISFFQSIDKGGMLQPDRGDNTRIYIAIGGALLIGGFLLLKSRKKGRA